MRRSTLILTVCNGLLVLVCLVIWSAALRTNHRLFSVSFIPAGKDGVVLVQAPGGNTVLIGAGADVGVVRALSSALPWWQRSIDVFIVPTTDPKQGGLPDIRAHYDIGQVQALRRGDVLALGRGAFIEMLFPSRALPDSAILSGCMVMKIVYGMTSFVVSCANTAVQEYVVRLDGKRLAADVLYTNGGTSSALFAGFVGAQIIAKKGETYVSDGQTVRRD